MFVFSTYLPIFLLKFRSRELIGCKIKFRIQRVPTWHTFDGPLYPKNKKFWKKTWWWCHHHIFSGISCFWCNGVHQKYAVWVLVGCETKFCIQRALPLGIWVKNTGRYAENMNKKSSFLLWQICQFNHNGWIDIFVIRENYFFCSYFRHISMPFYSNFKHESSLDAELNSASSRFFRYLLFLG